ncbi:hypothetical protein [Endozoicomonas sp.]|uniref:hypothetical protein n=1 Tax=Endozoicomonas sp. TaxID=1892382 RepID=UPI003AF73C87
MESTDTLHLELPSRSLGSLSFCANGSGTSIEQLERWTKNLSITDYQKNGESLANALDELTKLDCPPNELYRLIEMVRSPVLATATNLYQRYLKRYITFESGQQVWFELCHQLYSGLATAYKAVVQCCLDNNEHKDVLAAALHRAISESATMYLFHCLLYRPSSERLWLELHTLYQIAVQKSHQNFQQEDPYDKKRKPMSAENLYKRALLLSRSDTNKLSPTETQQVWQILSVWINHCKIQPQSGLKTYFSANLISDEGLQYAAPEPDKAHAGVIGLNVRVLTAHLDKIKKDPKVSKVLPAELIEHLTLSWGQIQKRSNPRRASSNHCETCFGFTGLHYHLSGKRNFDDIIAVHSESSGKSSFSEQSGDVWSQAHDAEIRDEDKQSSSSASEIISFNTEEFLDNKRLSALKTEIINSSHTGLCLKINGKLPQQFHAGELIGIRQTPESPWALYCVRWLGVSAQNEVKFGVNLITTSVDAAAISLIHKTQEASHFQRALLIPDPKETSMILPNFSAKEGAKFDLIHNDVLQKGQLMSCTYTTPIWCQYQFKLFG